MDENNKDEFIPSLTLDPNGSAAAAQAAPAPTAEGIADAAREAAPAPEPEKKAGEDAKAKPYKGNSYTRNDLVFGKRQSQAQSACEGYGIEIPKTIRALVYGVVASIKFYGYVQ